MKKTTLYEYFGSNGIVLGPVKIHGIDGVKKLKLVADEGNLLTRDNVNFFDSVVIPEADLSKWTEIPKNE